MEKSPTSIHERRSSGSADEELSASLDESRFSFEAELVLVEQFGQSRPPVSDDVGEEHAEKVPRESKQNADKIRRSLFI